MNISERIKQVKKRYDVEADMLLERMNAEGDIRAARFREKHPNWKLGRKKHEKK